MLYRYRARNFPQSLNEAERAKWQQYRYDKWHEGADVTATLARIEELIAAGEAAEVLSDLKTYVEGLWGSIQRDLRSFSVGVILRHLLIPLFKTVVRDNRGPLV